MDNAGNEHQRISAVGAELAAAREAQGLSVADIAGRTRIPQRHLSAIEDGAFAGLPAATYSTGFVRTYARLLGLNADDLAQRFRVELADTVPTGPYRQDAFEPADPARVPSRGLVWGTLALLVLLVVGYLYWRGTSLQNPAEVALAPASQPAPAAAAFTTPEQAPVSAAASPDVAPGVPNGPTLLTADEAVWLRVTDGQSKLYEGVLNAGDHFEVPATAADPRLRTSRATVLKVTVGSATIPPLGPPETLVKDVSLKPADLLAKVSAAPAAPPPAR